MATPINTVYPKNQFNPPETLARTSHSVTIKVNGITIGLINGWAPSMSRAATPIYELNVDTSGLILEHIPGNMSGQTVSISRYDIWPTRMEQAMGTVDLTMLANQQRPFAVQEFWRSPTGGTEIWEYSGVWFTSLGRNFQSSDQRIVNVSAQLVYTYRSLIQSL